MTSHLSQAHSALRKRSYCIIDHYRYFSPEQAVRGQPRCYLFPEGGTGPAIQSQAGTGKAN